MSTQTHGEALETVVSVRVARPRDCSLPRDARPARGKGTVSDLATQLARCARSYPLYDRSNDAVRTSLATLFRLAANALDTTPRLQLEIRPFEIVFDKECVYLDRDCERSLAFRLFSDGVRGLVLHRGLQAAELERLVAVLATRYAGCAQEEEDVVTLLFRARLRFVEVVAVEGLTQELAQAGGCVMSAPRRRPYLPEDVDLPLPEAGAEVAPQREEVEPAVLERLRGEAAGGQVAAECVRLLERLATALQDPRERMRFAEVAGLCVESLQALLSVERLPELLRFVGVLRGLSLPAAEWDPERHQAVVSVILACGSDRSVSRLLHSVSDARIPPGLIDLLDLVCPDPTTAVIEALMNERNDAGRAVARQLIEHYGRRQGPSLRRRFEEARGRVAADFLRSLARIESGASTEFMARQCGHPDPEVRAEALWHIEHAPFTSALGQALGEALRRTEGDDRRRVLAVVERSRDRRFVPPLLRLLESEQSLTAEAIEVARVVGSLEGPQGLERWRRRLTPRGPFFRRRLPGGAAQQVLAATAVAQVPGEPAGHLLRLALSACSKEARPFLERVLTQRDQTARGRRVQ